jgi:uncharacterized protein
MAPTMPQNDAQASTAAATKPTGDRGPRPRRHRTPNARPRDKLERPQPRDANGVEVVPDDIALSADDSLAEARRLLDDGRAFHAHEVLGSMWRGAPAQERELWRGLAKLAGGVAVIKVGAATEVEPDR